MNRVTASEIAELAGVSQSTVSRALRNSPLVNPVTRERNPSEQGGYQAAERLIDRAEGFSAVFCATDLNAMGAMRALRERGLSVPSDVSVVGFDDVPSIAYTLPGLTTVRQDTERAGHVLVETLLELIGGKRVTSQLLEPELIVRGSSGPKADGVPSVARTGPRPSKPSTSTRRPSRAAQL